MPIYLIDRIKPANGGGFPMVEATDVEMSDGSRLSAQPIMQTVTELPADAASHPNVLYLVVEDGDADTSEDGGSP